MMLYVNGSTHVSAAEATNPYIFASDDPVLAWMGHLPHPDNVSVSWGKLLSLALRAGLHCAVTSNNDNLQIINETKQWLENGRNQNELIIIMWNDWIDEKLEHDSIYLFHQQLKNTNKPHLFLNSNTCFSTNLAPYDWGVNFLQAYDPKMTFSNLIKDNKMYTVSPNSRHFGKDAHSFFNRYVLQYIITNKLI
jgi:hypothetical protein